MSHVFHDTLFAVIVRAVLGPTYFPHLDEMEPPDIYQRTIRRVKSSETAIGNGTTDSGDIRERRIAAFSELEAQKTQSVALQSSPTLGRGVEVHSDLPNTRGRSLEAFDEKERYVTQQMALQSSLTIVAPKEQAKSPNEEETDSLLVTWNGPDDPEVSQDHLSLG